MNQYLFKLTSLYYKKLKLIYEYKDKINKNRKNNIGLKSIVFYVIF